MKPLQAFFFDLDGTLVDSIPGIASSLTAAFASIGRVMPVVNLRDAIGPPIRTIVERLQPDLTKDETLAIEQFYRPTYDNEGWRETLLFPGVDGTLHRMHEDGFQLFIVTNKPRIPTLKLLEHFGLLKLFRVVLTRDSLTQFREPDRKLIAILHVVCRVLSGIRSSRFEKSVMV